MTKSDSQPAAESERICEQCGAKMMHLGVIRHFLKRSTTVFRCYNCNHVVVERN